MLKKRLIPVLLCRDGWIVQSINFKHTNMIGNAITAVDFFNTWSVDEIIILDVSKDTENREMIFDVIEGLSKKCFVPLSVGGWIREIDEIRMLLSKGADKVVINTLAFQTPEFITRCAERFGSQCIVVSIDAKRKDGGGYEVHIGQGRKPTGMSPVDWAQKAQRMGAGEIFLTSIDQDGSRQGYDIELMKSVSDAVNIPVIAFGGVWEWEHLVSGIRKGNVDAVAAGNVFHFTEHSTKHAKRYLQDSGINIRNS